MQCEALKNLTLHGLIRKLQIVFASWTNSVGRLRIRSRPVGFRTLSNIWIREDWYDSPSEMMRGSNDTLVERHQEDYQRQY